MTTNKCRFCGKIYDCTDQKRVSGGCPECQKKRLNTIPQPIQKEEERSAVAKECDDLCECIEGALVETPTPSDTFIDSKMKEFDNLTMAKSSSNLERTKYVSLNEAKQFLKSSLQEQEKQQLEIMTNAIEMSKIGWIEQGKIESRQSILEEIEKKLTNNENWEHKDWISYYDLKQLLK